jgi:hypothetical protein
LLRADFVARPTLKRAPLVLLSEGLR